jgi:hypothetical protein
MAEKSEPGCAAGRITPKVLCKNSANDVFVDLDAEGKGNLLGDPPARVTRVAALHFYDGRHEFSGWALRARRLATPRGEEPLIH